MFSASKSGQYQGYKISRSVRLRASANGFFSRSLVAGTNPVDTSNFRKTFSFWVKRGVLSSAQHIFSNSISSTNRWQINFPVGDTINVFAVEGGTTVLNLTTSAVFRDPSAWYHITIASDTTLATAADRIKIYVNGVLQTVTGTNATLNSSTAAFFFTPGSGTWFARIGNESANGTGVAQLDAYLTEINVIDGQTLTPSSFGVTNAYGVWSPTKYNGTYGNNGFYLNFNDNSGATATTIGKDSSGNGNNWTPNNITLSPTTSASYDSMLDVPTPWGDGGNGRGNYCTLNPLVVATLSGGATVSNGNLRVAGSAGVSNAYARGTMALSGKFYAEFFFDVVNATASIGVDVVTATAGALNTSSTAVSYRSGGNRRVLGTESAYGASWAANDIIGVAVDTTANTIEFFKNGVSQGVITSSAFFAQGDCIYAMSKDDVGSPTGYANFGQRPFSYTRPSGFNALNTFNLPEPSIDDGRLYMAATTYTGTGASLSVDNTVNNVSFQPDFVWVKGRSGATDHALYDAVRGVQKQIESNTTTAETTETTGLTAFNSNGFTVGALAQMNTNTATYVGWQWKEGATQGFDIVTYTGTLTTSGTVAINHNLGVAPKLVISKSRNNTGVDSGAWFVWTSVLATDNYLRLNTTAAAASISSGGGGTMIAPTGSVFYTPYISGSNINANNYVAYLFAEVAGFSRIGSYTGNGSANGPFVFCGFRPRFVMIKKTTTGAGDTNWIVQDTARDTYNQTQFKLYPSSSVAENGIGGETTTTNAMDILSNGFKLRSTSGATNESAGTFIFAAFAENPFKYSLAR